MIQHLNQPLNIGNKSIKKRLVLAPMTFLGHIAYRELLSTLGGYGLLFTEMCNARAIPHENRYVSPYFRWRDAELPHLVCQIFGADPVVMAAAADRIAAEGFFGVDINFGCSTGEICSRNCGAALLKDPPRAERIVDAVRKSISIPLFVKFRTGWQDDPQFAVDLAKRFECAGADALTFHPRVAPDRRSRRPKWEYIAMVKNAVDIPVFGNGNVFDHDDCTRILKETGCDGVAIGRIAIARPWTFASWTEGLAAGEEIYSTCALEMARLLGRHYDEKAAMRRYKRFAFYYAANLKFGHSFYKQVLNADNLTELHGVLLRFFDKSPEFVGRPNMNFFS